MAQRGTRLLGIAALLLITLAFYPARQAEGGAGSFTTANSDHTFGQLVVDPNNSRTVYAAGNDQSQNAYVFKSQDGGQTFGNTAPTLGQFSVLALAIAKIDPLTLYVGGYNFTTKQGVWYSTKDGGASWVLGATSLGNISIQAIVIDPTIASTVYLGTNSGIYKSTDHGATVSQLGTMGTRNVHSLAYDHNNPVNFYAGTDASTDPGVWKSTDQGTTWNSVDTGLPGGASVLQLAFDPTSTQTLYAGVAASPFVLVKTTNGGTNWATTYPAPEPIVSVAVDPLNGGNVYLTTTSTTWWSRDGGVTFNPIYNRGGGPVAVDGGSPQDVYVGGAGVSTLTLGPPVITVTPTSTPTPTPAPSPTATPAPGVNCQLPPDNGYGSYTFPLTGHTVSGVWLQFFKTHGDVDILGYPRTDVICDPVYGGQTVQYFQRAVLEYHPEHSAPYQIQPRLLVTQLYGGNADPPASQSNPPSGDSFYFPLGPNGAGHFVANVAPDGSHTYFKQFFDAHGKEDTFGYPLEEPKQRTAIDGSVHWTQHFQRAVYEYHPENDKPGNVPGTNNPYVTYRVQLTLLGDIFIQKHQLPYIPQS
mgnify:CR=1 FL=1